MRRYFVVPIALALLLTSCTQAPRPRPTVVVRLTERPAPVTAAPSLTEPAQPVAVATATLAPVTAATLTIAPTVRPTETATPTVPPTPVPSPTPVPTKVPTRRPPSPTSAPSPVPAPGAAWRGEYFANPDLSGNPALVRSDGDVNFDWGLGSPDPSLPADHFSVRWTRPVSLAAGRWRFHVTSDDGARLYVDGLPIIDQWHTTASITYNTSVALSGGNHYLRLDYYDNIEQARIHLWWEPDDGSKTDPAHTGVWRGDYFDNRDLSGTPAFSRDDPVVYFDWGYGGPGAGVDWKDFSVRWTRQGFLPGGRYLFAIKADDGVRLWFDGAAIIDQWHDSAGETTYKQEKDVSNGNHTLVVEYYQAGGGALAHLSWQPTSGDWLGNIHTCLPLQNAWIKVYRLAPNDQWEDLKPDGYGPNTADGQLSLWGVPIDASYGWDGQPYRVELWVGGNMAHSDGNIFASQPEFRIMPGQDVHTSWSCGAGLPTQ